MRKLLMTREIGNTAGNEISIQKSIDFKYANKNKTVEKNTPIYYSKKKKGK